MSKIFPFTGGGEVPQQKFFFQSEYVSSQIWCQKFFPLPVGGGGSLDKKNFFQSEHVSSQIWCQKFFPLPVGWGGPTKIFFSSVNMYQAKSGVKNFSLYRWGGGSLDKIFFFQCEHVSSQIWCQKFFPLLVGGGSLDKNFFFQSEHVSSQIWCQKFFPLLRPGTPPPNVNRQTPVKTVPSRHTTYAGGNNLTAVEQNCRPPQLDQQ